MKIGIIGAGEMGSCLASMFIKLGHTVSIANSRGPASLQRLAAQLDAEAVTVEEAITDKSVIVISIHQKFVQDLPQDLFRNLPKEVVIIDTGNYFPSLRGGAIPALDESGIDSLWVQEQVGFPVVKVFNSILATSLHDKGRARGKKGRVALPISGDYSPSKGVVCKLVDELGFDPFDVGTIAQSWKQQPGSSIYCRDIDLEETKRRIDAMGTAWSDMREAIIGKRKANEVLMQANYPAYLRSLQEWDS
jgi:predicted dinucleotide-binding enzyme